MFNNDDIFQVKLEIYKRFPSFPNYSFPNPSVITSILHISLFMPPMRAVSSVITNKNQWKILPNTV